MAKMYPNDKNFLIFKLNKKDRNNILFGNICDECYDCTSKNMYYVAIVNKCLCETCCNHFVDCMPHFKDPSERWHETMYFNLMIDILNLQDSKNVKHAFKKFEEWEDSDETQNVLI